MNTTRTTRPGKDSTMNSTTVLSFVLFSMLLGSTAVAQLSSPEILGTDLRPKGMGNAFIAVADDPSALFYNPAGLADVKTWYVHLVGVAPRFSYQLFETGMLIRKDAKTLGEKSQADQVTQVIDWIDPMIGTYHPFILGLTAPGFTVKNFSLRTFATPAIGLDMQNKVVPRFTAEAYATAGASMGFAMSWLDKGLITGASLKGLYRVFQPLEVEFAEMTGKDSKTGKSNMQTMVDDLTDMNKLVDRQGYGLGVDLGIKSHLIAFTDAIDIPALTETFRLLKPTVGVAWQDVGNTRFQMDIDEDEAFNPETIRKFKTIEQSLGVGVAISPEFGPTRLTYSLDVRDLNRDVDVANMINTGIELSIWDRLAVRTGLSQLSPASLFGITVPLNSAGIDVDLWIAKLGVYYFEDKLGTSRNARTSRQIGLSLNIGI